MIECKHCGRIIVEGEFKYCPFCGNDLSTDPSDKKKKKKTACSGVKRKTRVGYVLFGTLTLLIGIAACWLYGDIFFNSTLGAEKLAETFSKSLSFGGIREDLIYKLPFMGKALSFLTIILVIAFLASLFTLFSSKQNSGGVFFKLSAIFSTLAILLLFVVELLEGKNKLPKLVDLYYEKAWMIMAVCCGMALFNFIIAFLCMFNRKKAYVTTCTQFIKALYWIVPVIFITVYTLATAGKIKISDPAVIRYEDWYLRILCALPVYVLTLGIIMVAESRYSKKSSSKMK